MFVYKELKIHILIGLVGKQLTNLIYEQISFAGGGKWR